MLEPHTQIRYYGNRATMKNTYTPLYKSILQKILLKKLFSALSLFFIFLLGFFLRAQETISQNFLFLVDQGRDMLAVKSIVYDFHPTLIGPYTSLQGVFQGPLWYYLLGIPTRITGGNPWGSIVLMLILSLLVMLVTFLFMKHFFGKQAAFITLFLLAISPEAIAAATYAWNPHPMWLLLTLFIMCFYNLTLGKKKYHLFVWPLISSMFHFEAALAFFIGLTALMYILIFHFKTTKSKFFFYGLALSGIFFLPQILFELRHDFLMSRSVLHVLYGQNQGLMVRGEQASYWQIINGHLSTFFINFYSVFRPEVVSQKIAHIFLFSLIFFVIFGKKLSFLQEKERHFLSQIGIFVSILFLLTCLYPFPLRYWFLTGFQMFYIIPLGLLLSKLFRFKITTLFLLIFVFANIFFSVQKIQTLYLQPDYGGVAKIKGKKDAIHYIYKDAGEKQFGLLIFTPPVYTDAYDYLVWWKQRQTQSPLPHKEKKGVVYLLMEPDPGNYSSYNGWLETVIKTGTIISTKTLPSGIIVQKRIFK